ncbi:MAG TPA: dephospho-CoA kinase [Rubrivivax sp.]|nr:dephospho-CoA kinase [Rubrivivax sp.]
MDGLVGAAALQRAPAIGCIGLTGGIGSGKSTAAQGLVALGAWLVDTDAIARALTVPGGAAIPALAAEFGADAISADGALDRERMRRLAFADAGAKARLESILHPLIAAEAGRQAAAAGARPVVFDVPLLTESSHWRSRVERVLVIDCEEATQVARVSRRPGWTEAAARRVIEQQAPRAARRAIADAVICNDGLTLEQLQAELHALWALWHPQCAEAT